MSNVDRLDGVRFLQKPFRGRQLLVAVRDALNDVKETRTGATQT